LKMGNQTTLTTFILLGLTEDTRLKILLFIFLFLSYILSASGNLTIITLTLTDSHLKTPMYLFLQNFSFLEISFTTACIPRFLYSISSGDKSITYNACASQLVFIDLFGVTEFFLLATMSYDRYVAICKPLHYMTIMNSRVCKNFILFCWVAALIILLPPLSLGLGLDQKSMMRNQTVTTFILLGLTDDPQLKIMIFIFLFLSYMLSITGNLTIISLTFIDSHLKTAMYFFLQNFSFLEISFISACIPRYLYNLSTGDKAITYDNCVIQMFFTDLFGVTEFFLLAIMSYDRYVAICKPLHYVTIMNNRVCRRLIVWCWTTGLLIIIPPLSLGLQLEFCDANVIDHFFCDVSPLLKISCSETWLIEQMVIVCAVLTFIMTLVCVVLSYIYIIKAILRFSSAQQRKKAFSTCSSHM
ncbi:OR6C2 protein, partial [Crocuta crocuta]